MTTHDPTAAAHEQAAVFDVSDRGAVEVSGADAIAFVHNLCTNDIKKLPVGQGCEFFLTTNKARVVAHGWAYRLPPEKPATLWLDTGAGSAATVCQHLNRFIVSEQVEVIDRTAERAQFHVCGPQAPAAVEKALGGTLPELQDLQIATMLLGDSIVRVVRHHWLALPGYDLVCPAGGSADLAGRLQGAGAAPAGAEAFEILRVEAGFPLEGVDMDENRFVVEVGRVRQAISYTKGCYLGQEPIVMARDRGHVNRTLLGLKAAGTEPLPRGAAVLHNGREAGQVTSSVWSPRYKAVLALAYLKRGSQESGTAVEVAGREAVVAALPFPPVGLESGT
jgi:folate-binding protein YgfZ